MSGRRFVVAVPLAGLALTVAQASIDAQERSNVTDARSVSDSFAVRLVNISIPADCRIRYSGIDDPPTLYLELLENGERIGSYSTSACGWQPDYPDVTQNHWSPKNLRKTRYSIKVWESNWRSDDLVIEITGLKSDDLRGLVRERGLESEAPERLAWIEFESIEAAVPEPDGTSHPEQK